ncbi:hypothetical protein GCM10023320_54060 [Pseudonocardia adelaidensis]|uniref:Uncharacterized protein n=2 Tax=Pseudonocardia adelaidensis TaxID=648754 RepID=A0ABP9NTL1_9PSEU
MGREIELAPGRRVDGRVAIRFFTLDHALEFRTRPVIYRTVDPSTVTQRVVGSVVPCTPEENARWTEAAVACVAEIDSAARDLHEAHLRAAQPLPRRRARAERMRRDWDDAQRRYRSRFQAAVDRYSPVGLEISDAMRRQEELDRQRFLAERKAAELAEQRSEAIAKQRLGDLAGELRWSIRVSDSPSRTLHVVCVGVAPHAVPHDAAPLVEDVDVRTLRESIMEHRATGPVRFDESIDEHIRARFADLPGLARYTGLWRLWWDLFAEDYEPRERSRSNTATFGSSSTYSGFHC